uniref:PfkB family carbohydrate kinase n=1 Tax=Halorubrum sp. Boch-26 TaxID=2994426 RepID=UPI0024687FD3
MSRDGSGDGEDWDEEVAEWDEEVSEWEADDSDSPDGTRSTGDADPVDEDPDLAPEESGRVPKVIAAGHINWDVTIHVDRLPEPDGETRIDRLEQSGGGSAANVAVGLVDLGGQSVVYGSVGGDEKGAFLFCCLVGGVLFTPKKL